MGIYTRQVPPCGGAGLNPDLASPPEGGTLHGAKRGEALSSREGRAGQGRAAPDGQGRKPNLYTDLLIVRGRVSPGSWTRQKQVTRMRPSASSHPADAVRQSEPVEWGSSVAPLPHGVSDREASQSEHR